jgi:hypothetical protein
MQETKKTCELCGFNVKPSKILCPVCGTSFTAPLLNNATVSPPLPNIFKDEDVFFKITNETAKSMNEMDDLDRRRLELIESLTSHLVYTPPMVPPHYELLSESSLFLTFFRLRKLAIVEIKEFFECLHSKKMSLRDFFAYVRDNHISYMKEDK